MVHRWLLVPLALVGVMPLVTACGSDAASNSTGELTIDHAWARTSPAMVTSGAAYVTITSPVDDRLVGATVDASIAGSIELHETMTATAGDDTGATAESTMEMRAVNGIELPAGKTVAMAPGGYHLMMLDLAAALQRDQTFTITLTFQHAGTRDVTVTVGDDAPVIARDRRAFVGCALALTVGLVGCSHDQRASTMPAVELTSLVGGNGGAATITADRIDGPALINLWATWCGPCRTEMPTFQAVADEAVGDVAIIGINEGEDAVAAAAFLDDVDVHFDQYLDTDGAIIDRLRIAGLPATIVLDADGTIVSVHSGALDVDGIHRLVDTATD